MANEVQVSANLSVNRSGFSFTAGGSISITQSGTNNLGNVQSIGTSAETITFGDIGTLGYVILKNNDASNFVEVDAANTFDKFPQKILPGEFILMKPETSTIYAKADTAACELLVLAVEA